MHEIKFDGYRLQARIDRGEVKLLTRAGLDWTAKFGQPIVQALSRLSAKQAIVDCELVVENDVGASDFAMLQATLSAGATDGLILYVFDVMYLDGQDCRPLPLVERKARLKALLSADAGFIRYSEHFSQAGDDVLQHSCRLSLEGIISKLADAPYVSGRSAKWIKSKCMARQEFVIGGYALNAGTPRPSDLSYWASMRRASSSMWAVSVPAGADTSLMTFCSGCVHSRPVAALSQGA